MDEVALRYSGRIVEGYLDEGCSSLLLSQRQPVPFHIKTDGICVWTHPVDIMNIMSTNKMDGNGAAALLRCGCAGSEKNMAHSQMMEGRGSSFSGRATASVMASMVMELYTSSEV